MPRFAPPPAAWMSRPPGYELFFAPLQAKLDPTSQEMLQFAYTTSKYAHKGQLREAGTRYFDHPKAAAWIYITELGGRDTRAIAVILLHDVPEDCYLLSPYRMHLNFGEHIANDVRALTKLPPGKETITQYLQRIIDQGPWATLAKLCDRLHNIRTLGHCSPQKQRKQITETKKYHLAMLVPALVRCGEPWASHALELDRKIREGIAFYRVRLRRRSAKQKRSKR